MISDISEFIGSIVEEARDKKFRRTLYRGIGTVAVLGAVFFNTTFRDFLSDNLDRVKDRVYTKKITVPYNRDRLVIKRTSKQAMQKIELTRHLLYTSGIKKGAPEYYLETVLKADANNDGIIDNSEVDANYDRISEDIDIMSKKDTMPRKCSF